MPWIIAAVVVLIRITAVLPIAPVVAGDSIRYRSPSNPAAVFEVWMGQGPGVFDQTLFLLPGVWGVVAQVIVSGALWSAAAILLFAIAKRHKWLIFGLMLAASLNPWASIWDAWYLTEAVNIAGCVLAAVGCAVFVVGSAKRVPALTLAITGSAAAILSRPYSAVLVLPLLALALLLPPVWRRGIPRRVLLTGGAVVAVISLFAVWQVVEFEYIAGGGSMVQTRAAERLGLRGSDPGYLAAAKTHGMPSCPALETALTTPQTSTVRLDLARHSTCPGYQKWLQSGGLSWESELLANPISTMAAFVNPTYWVGASVLQYAAYDPRGHVLVTAFPTMVTLLGRALNVLTYLAGAASIVVAIVVAWRTKRRSSAFTVLLSLLWFGAFVFIAWADDGIENWRHVLPGLYAIGPFCWAVVAAVRPARDNAKFAYDTSE
jgi:hypothetical protein